MPNSNLAFPNLSTLGPLVHVKRITKQWWRSPLRAHYPYHPHFLMSSLLHPSFLKFTTHPLSPLVLPLTNLPTYFPLAFSFNLMSCHCRALLPVEPVTLEGQPPYPNQNQPSLRGWANLPPHFSCPNASGLRVHRLPEVKHRSQPPATSYIVGCWQTLRTKTTIDSAQLPPSLNAQPARFASDSSGAHVHLFWVAPFDCKRSVQCSTGIQNSTKFNGPPPLFGTLPSFPFV